MGVVNRRRNQTRRDPKFVDYCFYARCAQSENKTQKAVVWPTPERDIWTSDKDATCRIHLFSCINKKNLRVEDIPAYLAFPNEFNFCRCKTCCHLYLSSIFCVLCDCLLHNRMGEWNVKNVKTTHLYWHHFFWNLDRNNRAIQFLLWNDTTH